MKSAILTAMLLAATSGWAADDAEDPGGVEGEAQQETETVLEHLAEARRAFEDALREVEGIDFHQIFDDGAMLGVVIRDGGDAGVQVVGVTPAGGAEAAGILVDDLIVAINDRDLSNRKRPARLLRKAMHDVKPGETVQIALMRDGEKHNIEVEAMPRPHGAGPFHWRKGDHDVSVFPSGGKRVRILRDRAFARGRDGLELKDIGEDLGGYFGVDAGVLVLDVPPGSELRPGDVVRRINGADIGNAREAYRLLADLEEAGKATVRRENRVRTVVVEPVKGHIDRGRKHMRNRKHHRGEQEQIEVEVEMDMDME